MKTGTTPSARGAMPLALALGLVAGLSCRSPRPAFAQERPSDDTLRAIEDRGRSIASAIAAVAKGRDLMARQGQGVAHPDTVVTIEDHGLWRVFFLVEAHEGAPGMPKLGTLILAETEYSPLSDDVGALRIMGSPRSAPATTVSYARALRVAEDAAAGRSEASPPFDTAVVREKNGTFTVYLQSRSKESSKIPFGGDLVAHVAANGRQLMSIEPLHVVSTEVPLGGRPAGQPTLHEHPTGDLPTPTDVAQVCVHPAVAPHLVLTQRSIFRIDERGTLTYLGPNQAPARVP